MQPATTGIKHCSNGGSGISGGAGRQGVRGEGSAGCVCAGVCVPLLHEKPDCPCLRSL